VPAILNRSAAVSANSPEATVPSHSIVVSVPTIYKVYDDLVLELVSITVIVEDDPEGAAAAPWLRWPRHLTRANRSPQLSQAGKNVVYPQITSCSWWRLILTHASVRFPVSPALNSRVVAPRGATRPPYEKRIKR
jgi:hypothetical protein